MGHRQGGGGQRPARPPGARPAQGDLRDGLRHRRRAARRVVHEDYPAGHAAPLPPGRLRCRDAGRGAPCGLHLARRTRGRAARRARRLGRGRADSHRGVSGAHARSPHVDAQPGTRREAQPAAAQQRGALPRTESAKGRGHQHHGGGAAGRSVAGHAAPDAGGIRPAGAARAAHGPARQPLRPLADAPPAPRPHPVRGVRGADAYPLRKRRRPIPQPRPAVRGTAQRGGLRCVPVRPLPQHRRAHAGPAEQLRTLPPVWHEGLYPDGETHPRRTHLPQHGSGADHLPLQILRLRGTPQHQAAAPATHQRSRRGRGDDDGQHPARRGRWLRRRFRRGRQLRRRLVRRGRCHGWMVNPKPLKGLSLRQLRGYAKAPFRGLGVNLKFEIY